MGLPKKMYAGIMDGMIATHTDCADEYTPLMVALFASEREARKHYERVVPVDTAKLFAVPATAKRK